MDRHVPIHKPILWIYMLRNNLERLIFLAPACSVGDSETPRRGTEHLFIFQSGTFWAYGRQTGS